MGGTGRTGSQIEKNQKLSKNKIELVISIELLYEVANVLLYGTKTDDLEWLWVAIRGHKLFQGSLMTLQIARIPAPL